MAVIETVDARKVRLDDAAARKLLAGIDVLHVAKGKKVQRVDVRQALSPADASQLLLGPTGNLRAPTARIGRTLLIGFDDRTWSDVLG